MCHQFNRPVAGNPTHITPYMKRQTISPEAETDILKTDKTGIEVGNQLPNTLKLFWPVRFWV
jgi:hypothetical protein